MIENVKYNFEYSPAEKIRAGYIGCGGHSYRNLFPTFQYAPVDLAACCDLDGTRASAFARLFGAAEHYTDHRKLLCRDDLEAVFIVTNYDEQGHPRATDLAVEALRAGKHVWMEKPPAAGVEGIRRMRQAAKENGKFVLVGFKKMFFPAIRKVKSLIGTPAFGKLTSIYVRYPQDLPANLSDDRAMVGFLNHIVHPGSILHYLAGPVESIFYQRSGTTGATVTAIRFVNGAIGDAASGGRAVGHVAVGAVGGGGRGQQRGRGERHPPDLVSTGAGAGLWPVRGFRGGRGHCPAAVGAGVFAGHAGQQGPVPAGLCGRSAVLLPMRQVRQAAGIFRPGGRSGDHEVVRGPFPARRSEGHPALIPAPTAAQQVARSGQSAKG